MGGLDLDRVCDNIYCLASHIKAKLGREGIQGHSAKEGQGGTRFSHYCLFPLSCPQVLISFGCGFCVLFDLKYNTTQAAAKESKTDPHKRFWYDPGNSHVSWIGRWLRNMTYNARKFLQLEVWYLTCGQICKVSSGFWDYGYTYSLLV